jgi:putative MATE family efflux protein
MAGAANILVAQAVGAANWPMLKRVVGATATFVGVVSIGVAACGWLFAPHIIGMMGTPAESRADAIIYLRILATGLPMMSFFSFLQMAQQSSGDSRRPFYFMLIAIGMNLVLNPILIRGLGPFHPFGVAGSAMATVIGQTTALIAILVYLYRSHSPIMIRREDVHHLNPDREILMALIHRGLPITGNAVVWQISAAVMIGMVNSYGAVTAAAYTASSQVWNYMQMPAMALGSAATAMGAQNIGAGAWPRVDRVARSAVISALALTGSISLLLYFTVRHVLHVFLPVGSPAVDVAMHINFIVMWSFAMYSVSLQLIGIVRSTGAVWPAMIIAFLALVCARIAFAKLLIPYWGADAIWWSFPVGIFFSAGLHSLYYRYGGWRKVQMLKSSPQPAAKA